MSVDPIGDALRDMWLWMSDHAPWLWIACALWIALVVAATWP